jgi:aspartate-semialdehyde dehydrogenase
MSDTPKLKVGILGATGAVGQRFVQLLADHPWFEIAALPDPAWLLEGTGKCARHVKLKTRADVEKPAVRALLHAAVAAMR